MIRKLAKFEVENLLTVPNWKDSFHLEIFKVKVDEDVNGSINEYYLAETEGQVIDMIAKQHQRPEMVISRI
jgi:hypothetical protein